MCALVMVTQFIQTVERRRAYTNSKAISEITTQKLNQIVVLLATSVRRHRWSNFEIIVYSEISLRNIPATRGAMTFSL